MGKLTDAVKKNDIKTVQELLKKSTYTKGGFFSKPLINTETDKDGDAALHLAAYYGYLEILNLLLNSHANVNQPNNNGCTPLYVAAENGHVAAIEALLKKGANANQAEKSIGATPLHIAAQEGRVGSIQALLKGGAEVDQPIIEGGTPLHIAADNGHVEAIEALLQGGAKLDQFDNNGRTPLYIAAQMGHVGAIQTLLKDGANINQARNNGATPLYIATYFGNVEAVQVLLEGGGDVNLKTIDGKTALDIAKDKGHTETVKILETHILQQKKTSSLSSPLLLKKPMLVEDKYTSPSLQVQPKSDLLSNQLGVLEISLIIPYEELTWGKEIDRGYFGSVYYGNWSKHIDVAIKQLHVTCFSSEETLTAFKHEMEVMAQLRSPHIIQLYGICVAPYCMVMEYMPNGSLYYMLHSKATFSWREREPIALDISKGLFYLHHKNILHRDLKSLNVLLDKHMNAKLCDFGLAKVKTESSSQSNNGVPGTLLWMAPELLKRETVCTKESDVYSLGMTLWELASRELPFEDAASQAIAKDWIEKGKREAIPKDTPTPISNMITLCWSQEASKRPPIDQVVETLKVGNNIFPLTTQFQPKYPRNYFTQLAKK